MKRLTFRYQYDASFLDLNQTRDDFGRLSVTVATDSFSGRGGFWVQWQDVKEFGNALGTFPITAEHPVVVEWGFNMLEGDDLILRVEIKPANSRGDLAVGFVVSDDHHPECRVRGWFLTNYPDLEAFQHSIARLMNRDVEEAILTGQ